MTRTMVLLLVVEERDSVLPPVVETSGDEIPPSSRLPKSVLAKCPPVLELARKVGGR